MVKSFLLDFLISLQGRSPSMSRDFAKLPSHIMRDVYDELGSISEEAGEDQKKIKYIT